MQWRALFRTTTHSYDVDDVVLPEFWRPTSVNSISSFQKRLLNHSMILFIKPSNLGPPRETPPPRPTLSLVEDTTRHNRLTRQYDWAATRLAQPIRLLLKYTGTEFEDVQYDTGESWFSVKFTLGLDFPNLPYLFDGDLKFTESRAIMHYIARKNNLCGSTEPEKVAVEMVEGVVDGVKSRFTGMCYNAKFEEMKPDVMKYVNEKLKVLSAYLGEKKWFTGDAAFLERFEVSCIFLDPMIK
ncbi:Glutathione S-transferase Y1 [Geodia barretti]|uniref:glutathione transferase n=1 Tax=Geodia barretti TaxID=519541 RepID=A0AA35XAH8_GEOBA|nr:Glutathione S-transferase Y1 [Geodia barretti]